jgi:hypothetical protein
MMPFLRMFLGGGLRHHLRMPSDQQMLRLDPESEACFELLREIIAEEINARVAIGNSDPTLENVNLWAALAADAVLNAFVVRARPKELPRYKFVDK